MRVHTCSVTLKSYFYSMKYIDDRGPIGQRGVFLFSLPSSQKKFIYLPLHLLPQFLPSVQMLSLCLPQVEAAGNEGAVQLQRGMSPRMSAVGEHMTRASQPRYKYCYSISRRRSELWNLTPPFLDDLDSVTQTLLVKAVHPREGGGMLWACRQSLPVFSALVKVDLEL